MQRSRWLTTENLADFLLRVRSKLSIDIGEILERDEVSRYSNNNYLWRVVVRSRGRRRVLFVKQARPYNRRAWESKRQRLPVASERICGEERIIRYLTKLWGTGVVPAIHWFDAANYALIMSDVSGNGRLLIDEFAVGRIHPEIGGTLGKHLGALHSSTYRSAIDSCGGARWHKEMRRFFSSWWLAFGIKKFVPTFMLKEFYDSVERAPHAWIWGDAVYRNIFVQPCGRVSMVDFDHTLRYDPAIDCGMLLAHWMWMGVKSDPAKGGVILSEGRRPKSKDLGVDSLRFVQDFWKAYTKEFQKRKLAREIPEIQRRARRWAGIYLVSRTDGRSGSYFKKWPAWERRVRNLGVALFCERRTFAPWL